jgi:hypothetical protein
MGAVDGVDDEVGRRIDPREVDRRVGGDDDDDVGGEDVGEVADSCAAPAASRNVGTCGSW